MHTKLSYLSTSCNRTPNICDWGKNGLICFGACNSIVIHSPQEPGSFKNTKILIEHTNRINAVKWIRTADDTFENELVSASNDNTAIVWSLIENDYKPFVLKGHEDGVNLIECMYTDLEKNALIVVTASIDSTVRIWKRNKFAEEVTNFQKLDFQRGLSLALSLTYLPKTSDVLLACARDNSKIDLYAEINENDSKTFKVIQTLKGHENWVRGLDFVTDDKGAVYLASCAQDAFIRIWCISSSTDDITKKTLIEQLMAHKMRAMESNFNVQTSMGTKYFTVHLESILCGHEGWVYEVHWSPKVLNKDGILTQPMTILSSSLDKTMLIWTLNESTGLWMETMRVGEIGGNTLGFYGCKFSPDAKSIIGHGYSGSFHIWNLSKETDTWKPGVTFGGHSNEVTDMAWDPKGAFLASVSDDQTTRIHAPWIKSEEEANREDISWHELARPQVHGYDMSCIAMLSRYRFVSGAEEKIVRAFKAPSNFVANFRRICKVDTGDDDEGNEILNENSGVPKGASVPSLGLSNKAVFESSNEGHAEPKGKDAYPEDSYFHEILLDAPPTEENLLQNTLWPEIQKLYGHGFELFALAASHDGNFVASACKATTPEHAAIILWDSAAWQQKQKLQSHTLTVTQIMFSPDDRKLLTVSRDRRWTIYEKNLESNQYELKATTDKKTGVHSRIIWCCSFSHDSKYFATGSRDGKLVIWWRNNEKTPKDILGLYEVAGTPLELKGESITAVAFAPVLLNDDYLICLGLESGVMIFYKWNIDKWEKLHQLDQSSAHHLTVKRILFRPKVGLAGSRKANENVLQVASCSSDHSVKIHDLYLN